MRGSIDGAMHGGENSVVYMRYQCSDKPRKDAYYGQMIGEHTDSRPQRSRDAISQAPDTAVYSVSTGATMEFAIKKIESKLYEGDRPGDHIRVAPKKVPLTELEAGSLFAWPASAPGSADWRYKHLAGFTSPGDGVREVLVVRTMQVMEEYQLKAPYRCISVATNDTLPRSSALAGRPTTGQRVRVQFNVEGEGAKWFKGAVTAVNKNKFEVHFDFDGEKVWVGMDNEWQRDV